MFTITLKPADAVNNVRGITYTAQLKPTHDPDMPDIYCLVPETLCIEFVAQGLAVPGGAINFNFPNSPDVGEFTMQIDPERLEGLHDNDRLAAVERLDGEAIIDIYDWATRAASATINHTLEYVNNPVPFRTTFAQPVAQQ